MRLLDDPPQVGEQHVRGMLAVRCLDNLDLLDQVRESADGAGLDSVHRLT
jgi:hypothetical protein